MDKAAFHPTIIACILDRVNRWLYPGDIYPEPHEPPPECVQIAIEAQTSIGWGNCLRGYVATQWIDANESLYNVKHDTPKFIHVGAALVRPCIQYFLKRWIERNAALHGGTKKKRNENNKTYATYA
jgi:hypothetical protein